MAVRTLQCGHGTRSTSRRMRSNCTRCRPVHAPPERGLNGGPARAAGGGAVGVRGAVHVRLGVGLAKGLLVGSAPPGALALAEPALALGSPSGSGPATEERARVLELELACALELVLDCVPELVLACELDETLGGSASGAPAPVAAARGLCSSSDSGTEANPALLPLLRSVCSASRTRPRSSYSAAGLARRVHRPQVKETALTALIKHSANMPVLS